MRWILGMVVALASALPLAPHARADEAGEERRLSDLALDRMLEGQARIMAVVDRIRIAGAPLCGANVGPVLGVFAADDRTVDDMWRDIDIVEPFVEAGVARYGLGREPRVLAVVPGLAAAEAGLRAGDVVRAVDGEAVRRRVYLDVLRNHGEEGLVRLDVERDGARHTLAIEAPMGCAIPSRFRFGSDVNAHALTFGNITGVYFYSGLLHYLPDDAQLALIAGHELAHHILGHTNQPQTFERTEAEADYLGMYLAARAGFDVAAGAAVWSALGRLSPYSSIRFGFYSHPLTARRYIEQHATLDEIADKRASGASLEPEKGRLALKRPAVSPDAVDAQLAALRAEALALFRAQQRRIQTVSFRLVTRGSSACGERIAPVLGASLGRAHDFAWGKHEEVEAAFGAGKQVTVFAVAEGSPAEQAGLQVGDTIAEVDGRSIRRTEDVFEQLRSSASGPIALGVVRDGEALDLSAPRTLGCRFGTLVVPSTEASTESHDNREDAIVFTGLGEFARDDDELAIAIAHQLGHQMVGRFRSVKHEPRADEIGLRIAHAAGYDVRKAPAFWDRWAAEHFWAISADMGGDFVPHGAMSRRAPVIRETLAAIAADSSGIASE